MRLTDDQVRIIKARAAECFGPNAHVWLFGSRVDDDARGGDIDLYVELAEPLTDAAWHAKFSRLQGCEVSRTSMLPHRDGNSEAVRYEDAMPRGCSDPGWPKRLMS